MPTFNSAGTRIVAARMTSMRAFSTALPDHIIMSMPALSPTMETGNIASWNKAEGDEVSAGDILAEIETDKATVSFDSTEDGFIARILMPAGSQDVAVGSPVCIMVDNAEDISAFANWTPEAGAGADAAAPAAAAAEPVPAAPAAPATPAAPSKSYPSHTAMAMPALSPTMTTGVIASWNKKEGDKVNAGDILAEIETDKATVSFDSVEDG